MRVLVIEDQAQLRGAIERRLRAVGHAVDGVGRAEEADSFLRTYDYGAILLDRTLPDGDGVASLQRWRQAGISTPVLVLTARDRLEDRVEGLRCGADDYLVKPFAMEELLARVAAVARRRVSPESVLVHVADVDLNRARREVRRAGVLLPLRPKEFSLLELLCSRAEKVVTRAEIESACWDEAHEPAPNTVEALVASLRRKLGTPALIHTVRGHGYLLEARSDV